MNIEDLRPWCRGGASMADVARLEQALSITLPPEYRDYILNQDGGHFRGDVKFEVEGNWFTLASMFGINCNVEFCRLGSSENMGFVDNNDTVVQLPIGITERDELILLDIKDGSIDIDIDIAAGGEVYDIFESFYLFVAALEYR